MAKGLRLTKSERQSLKTLLDPVNINVGNYGNRLVKDAASILDKLELAEMPVAKGTYLTVNDAIDAFAGVLGKRLIAPTFQAVGVRAQMKNRIQALGLTRADCVTVAKVAGAQWQGAIRAESLVRQADKLLQESQLDLSGAPPKPKHASPVELSDDEI